MMTREFRLSPSLFSGALGALAALALSAPNIAAAATPTPRHFDPPGATDWKPAGCRAVPTVDPVVGAYDRWHLLHGDVLSRNEVSIALAPVFKATWNAEPDTFNVAGVTFDHAGNLYFSPFLPHENVVLISLDPATGARRWAIPGTGAPAGAVAPMVLADPDHPGDEVVYVALYDRAVAVRTDGTVVWDVPTGLTLAPELTHAAVPGINYVPAADAIVASSSDGHLYALDRRTGAQLLASPFQLPGAPSPTGTGPALPQSLVDAVQAELSGLIAFPKNASFLGFLQAILGDGVQVSNSFSVDPRTGRLWVTATAPDGADGKVDGVSELGALYGLDLVPAGKGRAVQVACSHTFKGGSASTPAVYADGSRIYIGDNGENLIALDDTCKEVWSFPVGGQIVGAVAVASDNHELYVATQTDILQILDRGSTVRMGWKASLDAYMPAAAGQENFNLLLASIGANGIGVTIGAGLPPGAAAKVGLPLAVGYGVLDRATGQLRYFADGLDESVAEMNVGPDGAYYSPSSPVLRAFARVLFPGDTPPVQGGIRKFAPKQQGLLVRDALCAAADRAENALAHAAECADAAAADGSQIQDLVAQARRTAPLALADGSLSHAGWTCADQLLAAAPSTLAEMAPALRQACAAVQDSAACPAAPAASAGGCGCRVDASGEGAGGLSALAFCAAVALARRSRRGGG